MKNSLTKIQEVNKALQEMMCADPLTEFQEPKTELEYEMNYGLAQVYGNKGFRTYVENEINRAIKNSALRAETPEDIMFSKARILTLKELLVISKRSFINLEKLELLRKGK